MQYSNDTVDANIYYWRSKIESYELSLQYLSWFQSRTSKKVLKEDIEYAKEQLEQWEHYKRKFYSDVKKD
jgi:hypothetical protein